MAAACGPAQGPTMVNPPPPPGPEPAGGAVPQPAPAGDITKRDDGTCWRVEKIECPPQPATCNPPPPVQVDCPPGM